MIRRLAAAALVVVALLLPRAAGAQGQPCDHCSTQAQKMRALAAQLDARAADEDKNQLASMAAISRAQAQKAREAADQYEADHRICAGGGAGRVCGTGAKGAAPAPADGAAGAAPGGPTTGTKEALDRMRDAAAGAGSTRYSGAGPGSGAGGAVSLDDAGEQALASYYLGDMTPPTRAELEALRRQDRLREKGFVELLGQGLANLLGVWRLLSGPVPFQLQWPPPAPPQPKRPVCLPDEQGDLPEGCFTDVHANNPDWPPLPGP